MIQSCSQNGNRREDEFNSIDQINGLRNEVCGENDVALATRVAHDTINPLVNSAM